MTKPRSTARLPVETFTYRCTVGLKSLPDLCGDFEWFIVQYALERLSGSLIRTSEAIQITRGRFRMILERLNIPEPAAPNPPPD